MSHPSLIYCFILYIVLLLLVCNLLKQWVLTVLSKEVFDLQRMMMVISIIMVIVMMITIIFLSLFLDIYMSLSFVLCPPARSVHVCEIIYVVMHVVLYHKIVDEEKERSRQVRSRGRLEGEFWMD